MVFVYIRIYFAAKARARRGIRKQPRPRAVMPPESPDVRQTSFTQSTPATESKKQPGSAMENVATIENQPVQIPIVTCDFASDVSTSEADPGGGNSIPMEEKDTLKVNALIYFKWCLFFLFYILLVIFWVILSIHKLNMSSRISVRIPLNDNIQKSTHSLLFVNSTYQISQSSFMKYEARIALLIWNCMERYLRWKYSFS